MTPPRIVAVVVTYNSASTIGQALAALRGCHDAGVARTVVVDNASTDDTKAILDQNSDWITIVDSPGNIGFGRGCNLGLAIVDEPYVVFVNPDAVIEQHACRALAQFLDENPRAAMVSPAIINTDGSVQHVGGITTPLSLIIAASGINIAPQGRKLAIPGTAPFRTDWLCGALIMARSSVLKELGGFDPRFFLYFEETDLCRRVSYGHELWAVPTAIATHVGGASSESSNQSRMSNCVAEHYFQSRYYYLRKHFGIVRAATTEICELVLVLLRAAGRRLQGRSSEDLTRRFGWPMFRIPEPRP